MNRKVDEYKDTIRKKGCNPSASPKICQHDCQHKIIIVGGWGHYCESLLYRLLPASFGYKNATLRSHMPLMVGVPAHAGMQIVVWLAEYGRADLIFLFDGWRQLYPARQTGCRNIHSVKSDILNSAIGMSKPPIRFGLLIMSMLTPDTCVIWMAGLFYIWNESSVNLAVGSDNVWGISPLIHLLRKPFPT